MSKAYKSVPTSNGPEIKFYDADHRERLDVLAEVADSDSTIVYVCIDKKDYREPYRCGNELYQKALKKLIEHALEISDSRDVNILVDESRFIKNNELVEIGNDVSKNLGKNVKRCVKVSSDRCTRIADYIAGSLWAKYERGNEEYFKLIEKRISVACESLRPRKLATDITGLIGI